MLNATKEDLMFLVMNEKSGHLHDKLEVLYHLLCHCLKEKMNPKKIGQRKRKFDSIHCDLWNRYAQNVSGIV